jgi:hypothetical protein
LERRLEQSIRFVTSRARIEPPPIGPGFAVAAPQFVDMWIEAAVSI